MNAKNDDACSIDTLTEPGDKTRRTRALNDELRKNGTGGRFLVTQGIMAFGTEFAGEVLKATRDFDKFSEDNDPWEEHDCGCMTVADRGVMWKIDYYDRTETHYSPDPSSNKVTVRVLTMMLASEY